MAPPPHDTVVAVALKDDAAAEPGAKAALASSATSEALFTSEERAAMKAGWDIATQAATTADNEEARKEVFKALGGQFINNLFTEHPNLMYLFEFTRGAKAGQVDPVRMQLHGAKTIGFVDVAVGMVARGEDAEIVAAVDALVKRHVRYKVLYEHYDQVLGTLGAFLSGALGAAGKWDDVQARGWSKMFEAIKGLAIKVYPELNPSAAPA